MSATSWPPLNGLQVGDTLPLVNPNDESEAVTLTIAGLYHNSASGAEQGGMMKGFSAASDRPTRCI